MKDLRKLAEEILAEKSHVSKSNFTKIRYANIVCPKHAIDAMLSFHEQASKDMFTTDDMLGFAEHCRLTEVLPTYDNLDIWLAIKDK